MLIPCAEYVDFILLQAHGPFIYVHWFGTVPSMQRQGYGGQVMKAVSHHPSSVYTALGGILLPGNVHNTNHTQRTANTDTYILLTA